MDVFIELTSVIVLATVISIIMKAFKQPLVIGYILTGIIIGPSFFNIIHSNEYMELFSKFGITILLFIVGINLSPKVIREVGKISFIGGILQIGLTGLAGAGLYMLLGNGLVPALYISAGVAFSSTIVILKILSDKGDLQKLYAKITVGFLIVQDLVAIGLLMLPATFATSSTDSALWMLVSMLLKIIVIIGIFFVLSKFVLPKSIHYIAGTQELLFLFSITWGFGMASVFFLLGFSIEVGALMAGVSLSTTHYAEGIASRLKPLRDFFIVLFFVSLGSGMMLDTIKIVVVPALIVSLFVLIGKPLLIFLIMNVLGYKTRPSFYTAVSLAQISEFSLILAGAGLSAGQLRESDMALLTLVALVTITVSSYLMTYSALWYERFEKILKFIEIKKNRGIIHESEEVHDLLLFGYDRVGENFIEAFAQLDKKYAVIDFNPDLIKQMHNNNIPFRYGDVSDIEFLQELNLRHVKLCVSTIPNFSVNSLLIKKIREVNDNAIIIVRARISDEAKGLYALGASYVVMPHYLGSEYAKKMIISHGLDPKGFDEERKRHLEKVDRFDS